jgi:hypothetical protein
VRVSPKSTIALAMALQELAANAVARGALSAPEGRVELDWRAEGGRVAPEWREIGGPPASAPVASGFGGFFFGRMLAADLGAPAEMAQAPGGLICRMSASAVGARPAIASQPRAPSKQVWLLRFARWLLWRGGRLRARSRERDERMAHKVDEGLMPGDAPSCQPQELTLQLRHEERSGHLRLDVAPRLLEDPGALQMAARVGHLSLGVLRHEPGQIGRAGGHLKRQQAAARRVAAFAFADFMTHPLQQSW